MAKKKVSKLEEVMAYLGQVTGLSSEIVSIVDAIKVDHQALKNFIKVLKDEDAPAAAKRKVFPQFVALLKSHSAAEEKALYALSLKMPGLKPKTLEGFVEHDTANTLAKKTPVNPSPKQLDMWLAKAQVLAELVLHHVEEEESDLLPEVKKHLSAKAQLASCQKFVLLRHQTQKKPTKDSAGVLAVAAGTGA